METKLIKSKTQKTNECSKAIEKAIQPANEALYECGYIGYSQSKG